MAEYIIQYKNSTGDKLYPVTLATAVVDRNGENIEEKLTKIDSNISSLNVSVDDLKTRLERSFDYYDKKMELIEDSVEVLDKTVQKILVQNGLIETRLELVNEKLEGVDLDAVANVLTKVETMETDLADVKRSIDDLENREINWTDVQ